MSPGPYPVVSLITVDPRLGRDFLRWVQPYAVQPRVFASGEALLGDLEGARTRLLLLAPKAPDLPLRDLLRRLRESGTAEVICLDDEDDVPAAVDALRCGAVDILEAGKAEIGLVRHLQRILAHGTH